MSQTSFCNEKNVLITLEQCRLTCVKIFLVQHSNKAVSLDLAPFSEKVDNHCSRAAFSKLLSKSYVCQNKAKLCTNVSKGAPQQF